MDKSKLSIADNNQTRKTAPSEVAPQCSGSKKGIEFSVIPRQDLEWATEQKPAIMQLFLECWRSDPYGSRWMQLSTKLKKTAFTEAKKQLSDQGLFVFKTDSSIQDSRRTICWMVKNLHGSRVKGFWKEFADTNLETADTNLETASTNLEFASTNLEFASTNLEFADTNCISPQTLTQSGVQERSISFQYLFNKDLHQQFNNASGGLLADEKKAAEEEEEEEEANQGAEDPGTLQEPEPTGILEEPRPDPITQVQQATVQLLDEREIFDDLRRLGIETNETVRATMKKYKANVPDAIAHIKQRYNNHERFKNVTGAFVKACTEGAKPRPTTRTQANPPTIEQMTQLEQAKVAGDIRDFYLVPTSSDREVVVVDTGSAIMLWWEYLT